MYINKKMLSLILILTNINQVSYNSYNNFKRKLISNTNFKEQKGDIQEGDIEIIIEVEDNNNKLKRKAPVNQENVFDIYSNSAIKSNCPNNCTCPSKNELIKQSEKIIISCEFFKNSMKNFLKNQQQLSEDYMEKIISFIEENDINSCDCKHNIIDDKYIEHKKECFKKNTTDFYPKIYYLINSGNIKKINENVKSYFLSNINLKIRNENFFIKSLKNLPQKNNLKKVKI